ncbi:P-loop containing nucleoside triphosphate hydrolase protein [Zopfochytrium polystomum]|nr:P-loop containing nucleoside triphosphate hydrolase protein [Zopfochytrium polystomum]
MPKRNAAAGANRQRRRGGGADDAAGKGGGGRKAGNGEGRSRKGEGRRSGQTSGGVPRSDRGPAKGGKRDSTPTTTQRKGGQGKLVKAKASADVPRLHLDSATISRLKAILQEYREAKRVLDMELAGGESDSCGSSSESGEESEEESDDEEDESDFDSDDDELDIQDLLENWDMDSRNSQESWSDEISSKEGEAFVDQDDVPEPEMSVKASALSMAASANVSSQDLFWIENIGFPPFRALEALKACKGRDRLDALQLLYSEALKKRDTPDPSRGPLETFSVSREEMLFSRNEERMVLESMFGDQFERVSADLWKISVRTAVPELYVREERISGDTASYIVEIHFPMASCYPYEAPIVIFRDTRAYLPKKYQLYLSLGLQSAAESWVGQPMVFSLLSWLQDEEAANVLMDPPRGFVDVSEDIPTALDRPKQKEVAIPPVRKPQRIDGPKNSRKEMSTGPVPPYSQLKQGLGVAIVLKQDQPTGRTVMGFIREVLTRGDHPRGVKVRLTDGRVGRVKFLTGRMESNESSSASKTSKSAKIAKQQQPAKSAPSFISGFGAKPAVEINHPSTPLVRSFMPNVSDAVLDSQSRIVLDKFVQQQQTSAYRSIQGQREGLPAFTFKDKILATVKSHQVVIVSGETGCGKSTQVPQFILDDAILSCKGARCKILVTQPRRISAIGLAERVSNERGESVGLSVGYNIRLENKMSDLTRILYCTTGILLRRLETGPKGEAVEGGIDDISHIVVDEVHERSLDSDFLLMVLKDLLAVRSDLRLILMSATLNAELFANYFGDAPVVHIPGRTFPVKVLYLENALMVTKYKPEGSDYIKKIRSQPSKVESLSRSNKSVKAAPENRYIPDEELDVPGLKKRYPVLSDEAAKSLVQMDLDKIHYPLMEKLILWIIDQLSQSKQQKKAKGNSNVSQSGQAGPQFGQSFLSHAKNRGILVFLPGYAEISTLHEGLLQNAFVRAATGNGRFCLALHSTLSSEEQMRVFNRPPDGVVKIVIATNVAETSITIDDIVYVIDSGRMKETRFDPQKGMSSLEECWVSRANATQRRGRAGRVQEGTCIHLFTSSKMEIQLLEQQPPEIHRTPLEQICLRVKILPFLTGPIDRILSKIVEPPSKETVKAAIATLRTLRALTKDEELTPLGFHLGRLPVDVRIGKLILFGAIFRCLDPVLTIASAMSVKSPFVAPFEKRDLADEKKQEFATGVSDHLTVLTAYNEWQKARSRGFGIERKFLFDNFLSGRTLTMIASVKRQLAELLSDIGFVPGKIRARDMERRGGRVSDGVALSIGEAGDSRNDDLELIKGVIISGLYPNVIKMESGSGGKGGKLFARGNEEVFLHPSSVNWKVSSFPSPYLVYHEKVKTTKVYIRDCSSVSPYALAFFGGRLTLDRKQKLLNLDDGWIHFRATPRAAATLEATRAAFDELLSLKIENPELDVSTTNLVREIVSLVTHRQ